MTVALGLVCTNGVIVAADSMGSSGRVTTHSKKVHAANSIPVVWTASGTQYVAEEVEAALLDLDVNASTDNRLLAPFTQPNLTALRSRLDDVIRPTLRGCYEQSLLPGGTPLQNGRHPFASDFLILGWSGGQPYFLEFAGDGQVNWHHDRKFAAVGSGGEFATVAGALMQHYLSGPGELTVERGLQVAWRTIDTVCNVSAAFVGHPVQLAVADERGPRVLDSDEVEQVQASVDGWKQIEVESLFGRIPGREESPDELPEIGSDIRD